MYYSFKVFLTVLLSFLIGMPTYARLTQDQEKKLKKEFKLKDLEYVNSVNGFEYYIASNNKYKGIIDASTGKIVIPCEMETIEFINVPETNGWFLTKQKNNKEPLYSSLFDVEGDCLINKADNIEINPDHSCVYTLKKEIFVSTEKDRWENLSRGTVETLLVKKGGIFLKDPSMQVPACFNTVKYNGNGSWVVSSLESAGFDIPFEKDFRYPSEDSNLFLTSIYNENNLALMEEAIKQNDNNDPLNKFYLGMAYLREGKLRSLEYQVFGIFYKSFEGIDPDIKISLMNNYLKSMKIDNDEIKSLIDRGLELINDFSAQDNRYDEQINALRKQEYVFADVFAEFDSSVAAFRQEEAQHNAAVQAAKASQDNFFVDILRDVLGAVVCSTVDNFTSSVRGASRSYAKAPAINSSGQSGAGINGSNNDGGSSNGGLSQNVQSRIRAVERNLRHEEEQLQKSQERYQKNHDSGEKRVMEAHKRAIEGYTRQIENLKSGRY